jgi:hypothetical protein
MTICDVWSGAKNLTDKRHTDSELMRIIYSKNGPESLRREARRLNSGIYVVRNLGSGALLAAARVGLIEGRYAPKYGHDDEGGNPMYMGFFGASADADNDWPNYLQSMVDQAREDFGKLGRGRVTKLCAYASSDADERFAEAVRGINPRTYEKHGEKMGSFGDVGGVARSYFRHDVEFETPQNSHIRKALSNAARPLLGVFSKSLLDPVPARTGSTEEIPVAA